MADKQHPLHGNYVFSKSGKRMALPEKYRFEKSFIPKSVKLFKHFLETKFKKIEIMDDAWIVCT